MHQDPLLVLSLVPLKLAMTKPSNAPNDDKVGTITTYCFFPIYAPVFLWDEIRQAVEEKVSLPRAALSLLWCAGPHFGMFWTVWTPPEIWSTKNRNKYHFINTLRPGQKKPFCRRHFQEGLHQRKICIFIKICSDPSLGPVWISNKIHHKVLDEIT